jgi:hypothetical protein
MLPLKQTVFQTGPRLLLQKPVSIQARFSAEKTPKKDIHEVSQEITRSAQQESQPKPSWWTRLKTNLKQWVFPVSLLGTAWIGGVHGTGAANPLIYGGMPPSELVAKEPTPLPISSQYAHGYLYTVPQTGEWFFHSSFTGKSIPMETPSEAKLSQWFGVGEPVVIRGNVLAVSDAGKPALEMDALMPVSAFLLSSFSNTLALNSPNASETQAQQQIYHGTVGYDRATKQWMLIDSQSNAQYVLKGLTPEKLTQWLRPNQFVQIRFEMPPQTVSQQQGATPKGRLLQINPM